MRGDWKFIIIPVDALVVRIYIMLKKDVFDLTIVKKQFK